MTDITHLQPNVAPQEQDVVILRCPDQMHFDPAPLNRLFALKDAAEAEEVICRVLEDIALRLDMMQTDMAKSAFSKLVKPAARIAAVADQIGLTEVAIAAGHVSQCLEQRDGVALEATMARLERGFDVAVSEVWNFRDH
ncbi:hypothetical protein DFP92_10492 [Yoonia sediminilitoris]|uniref:Hpt domain-containing protein n=1 Tax=Yoonia sediminilitoris TaxID=1286148 RepID=A0A2T6KIC2_9RHOB|nr:hypothetical protein C8N45_10492 [Yoonia sediminilitoris]RCW96082.1 hypothetical protein DFP92_10492 [Yoonia sediminilitoris]